MPRNDAAEEAPAGPAAASGRPDAAGEGTLVLIVGPSGAGKDTLIAYARARLGERADVCFVRRVVTRAADAALEDHDTISADAFADLAENGAFALHWRAHGLCYGLPRNIEDALASGATVVANVSRSTVDAARRRYRRVLVVMVTAPPEVLAARLAARGRETPAAVAARLARAADAPLAEVVEIDNAGSVEVAGDALVRLIERSRGGATGV